MNMIELFEERGGPRFLESYEGAGGFGYNISCLVLSVKHLFEQLWWW